MKISLIAAMDKNRVIGYRNQMPWHLPADFKHFKETTMGKPIIMGRNTWESLAKPLPGRTNIVVTRQKDFQAYGALIVSSLEQALHLQDEVFVIGGAQLYEQALPLAHTLYLTFIDHDFTGDTYFPAWNKAEWRVIHEEKHPPDEKNIYHYTFQTLIRLN